MGRSIYFTDLEIEKLIDYVSDSVELLGEAEGTREQTAEDMENGLGSAIRNYIKAEEAKRFMQNTRRKEGKVMLKPTVKASEFTKYGFERCRELPKRAECYSWNHGAGKGNNE